jgi:hypothetical protein
LIEHVPFSKQMDPSVPALTLPLLLGCGLAAGIAIAVQYFLIFQSSVVVSIVVLGGATCSGHLGPLWAETGAIYKEIAV